MDTFSREQRSEIMRHVHSRDTAPEMAVRRITHALGFRYRLHVRDLPGCPDMVFPARRKVIFVHGCFWHQHGCEASALPASNRAYWLRKLQRNADRDKRIAAELRRAGWKVLIIWECQIRNRANLTKKILHFLAGERDE